MPCNPTELYQRFGGTCSFHPSIIFFLGLLSDNEDCGACSPETLMKFYSCHTTHCYNLEYKNICTVEVSENKFLQNVCTFLPDYAASYPRK
jgi:hypothetical protein